jgi:N-methylhydantoinase A
MNAAAIGVDIGGTFTDVIVAAEDGGLHRAKVLSSPPDFGQAVLDGLARLAETSGLDLGTAVTLVHGTTVATNAILEGRGARTALVTTRGFRDVLELGRMRRPSLYDLFWDKPEPLVPRRLRLELDQRIAPDGEIERAPTEEDLEAVAEQLRGEGIDSLAVCLLNSYRNPDEERRIAERLSDRMRNGYVTASVDIVPEIHEYERSSTAVVNAYVRPTMDRYVAGLERGLADAGVSAPLLIMQSAGGLLTGADARTKPVQLIESGPAAGVIAAQTLAARLELRDAITFDMGGTTAKASVIEGGTPFEASEYEVGGGMNSRHGLTKGGGYAIRVPALDIAEVGAGGGSVIWVDRGGAPRVGPQSAGAAPGPACYGLGGTEPTLTDALVVLGYVSQHALAGGTQSIAPELAERALATVADPLGISVLDAALGAYRIAVSNMSRAVKAVTSERGRDPRRFSLLAFGGAGPAYAVELGREFQIPFVVVPPNAGLFSTVGLLLADLQFHDVASTTRRESPDPVGIAAAFAAMEERMSGADEYTRFADMRYVGQSSELRIRVPAGEVTDETLAELREAFDAEHERTYGHRGDDQRVEIVNLRLRGASAQPGRHKDELFAAPARNGSYAARGATRGAYFSAGRIETPVVARVAVPLDPTPGPLIVEDMDATTVVPPGATCRLDALGNLIIATS